MFNINFCRWLDSNHGPLESEVTALPTEPQPLPENDLLWGQDDDGENVSKKSKSADDAEEDALAPELELGPNVELVITQAAAVGDVEAGIGHVRLGHVDVRIILYLKTCSR